jgi:hypothetical protein
MKSRVSKEIEKKTKTVDELRNPNEVEWKKSRN